MVSDSPSPLAYKVLSEPPACTRTHLRGRHATDHEGSYVSPWVGGSWTLQGQLLVRANSMVEVSMGHSSCGPLCRKGAYRS